MNERNIFVSGGAGFIGSHVIERLMNSKANVVVFDNLSSGSLHNISKWLGSSNLKLIQGDLLDQMMIEKSIRGCELVIHLAANPEVAVGYEDTTLDLKQNVICTHNLLEAMRKSDARTILFTSTSTVYGDAKTLPTAEDYAPLMPISNYGASKLACEAFVSSYSHLYGMKAFIFRFANIVGKRGQ